MAVKLAVVNPNPVSDTNEANNLPHGTLRIRGDFSFVDHNGDTRTIRVPVATDYYIPYVQAHDRANKIRANNRELNITAKFSVDL